MSDTWNDLTEDDWHQLTQDDWHQSLFSSDVTVVCDPTTVEFAALALELMNEFLHSNNASWLVKSSNVPDSDRPFEVALPTETSYPVKIAFFPDKLEDRQLFKYMKDTTIGTGQVNGWMVPSSSFTPKISDTVLWNGRVLDVKAADPIQPIDCPIVYFIEFGA